MRTLAYLDPGSGSMILQMLLGGVAAVAVSIKMFGKKVFRHPGLLEEGRAREGRAGAGFGGRVQEGSREGDRLARFSRAPAGSGYADRGLGRDWIVP